MATTTAEPYHLRALILKIQDYLTDQDRQRLHFFLGPDVPRRIRDDISLTGTLNLIESLIEQDKINEQDFTFLINAFEVIQCHDAVKILKDCMKQMQTKGQSETLHKVSSILLDEHQEDKYARENLYVVVDIHSSHDTDNKATSDPIDTPTVHPLTIAVAESSSHMKPNQLLKIMKIVLITFVLLIFIGLIISTSIIATQNMKLKKELQTKEANLVDEQLMIKNYSNVNTKLMQQIVSLKQTILLSNMSQIPIGTKVMRNGVTIAGGDGKGDRLDQLLNPLFMTIADDRTIYISDQYNHRIVAWKKNATNGEIVAGGNGDGIQEDQLRYPRGVIIDRKTNTLIIADNGNKRVIRWPRQNGVKGETIISGIDCWGLAWDSSGDLYVSNREKNEVRRWKIGEDEGVLVAGGNGQGFDLNQLNGPRHLHIDQNDALYISDNGNSRVMKWTKGAKQGSIAGGGYGMGDSLRQFHFPNGIVVDQSGTLYVADYDNDRVMRWLNNATQGEVFVGGNGRGRRSRSSKVIHVRIRSSKFSSTNQCTSNIQQKSSSSLTTKTSQLSDYKSVINNLQHSAESKWINKSDVVDDHHRRLKKEKAKKCSRRRIVASLVIGFCLLILILVAILIPLLITIKPTKKNIYPDGTPLLRWHSDGITIAGVSSVSGTTANLLNYPYDLVVDWEYTLYVADRSNNRIQKFLRGSSNGITVAGQANGAAGVSADAFSSSAFLLVDDDGNVNISDANNNRVMFWQKNAAKGTMVAGDGTLGNSTNQLNMPHGLAYDGQSNTLFVGDLYNHRVMKYSYHNTSGILFAGDNTPGTSRTQLWSPHGLFFEQSSNSILIANAQAHNIVRWVLGDSQWSIVVGNSNGIGGSSSSFLYLPTDIMLDPMKNIYVVDRGNNRVQFFPFGQLNATTIAGKTGILGSNATLLNIPNSLTLDNQLNLYVADWQNHRIQKFLRY